MNNPVKLIVGSLLGAGVGVGMSKLASTAAHSDPDSPEAIDNQPRETLRERWARARVTGEVARAEKEEELRAYFRAKVKDQNALRDTPTI